MSPAIRAPAIFVACAAVLALTPAAVADPGDPIPGNGVFRVGPDIAPGLYRTAGTASTWGVWINNIPTQDEMCSWFTYDTPDAKQRPCRPSEQLDGSDVREYQHHDQGLRVAELSTVDSGSMSEV